MKKKINKLNRAAIDSLKKQIDQAFPWKGKKAFYVESPDALSVSNSEEYKRLFVSAVAELRDDGVALRTYHHSEAADPRYDVDEIRNVDKVVVEVPDKEDIEGHHMNADVAENIMERNNIAIEVVPDGKGGAKINVQSDGTVKALINFVENLPKEIRDQLSERKNNGDL